MKAVLLQMSECETIFMCTRYFLKHQENLFYIFLFIFLNGRLGTQLLELDPRYISTILKTYFLSTNGLKCF